MDFFLIFFRLKENPDGVKNGSVQWDMALYTHIVLGSNGGIGASIVDQLLRAGKPVIGVTQSGRDAYGRTFPVRAANAFKQQELVAACQGGSIVYHAIGASAYETAVWRKELPVLMQNAVVAAQANNARLVYIDNLYSYQDQKGKPYFETTPVNPPSEKGTIRAELVQNLLDTMSAGQVFGTIIRGSSYYGPYGRNSLLGERFFKAALQGKTASFVHTLDSPFTYTYTIDFARAAIMAAEQDKALSQIFHVPTAGPVTLRQLITGTYLLLGKQPKLFVLPKAILPVLGIFSPLLRSLSEMTYENDFPFIVNAEKFNTYFGSFQPTSYAEGLKTTVAWFRWFMKA